MSLNSSLQQDDTYTDRARHYTLFVLTVTYAFHVLDRYVLAVLLPQIKQEMQINDFLIGLMTGPTFAVLYSLMAVPVAMLADRSIRKNIFAACTAMFSLMTCLSGLAANFTLLLLTRMGVAIGESGTSPSALAMIADLYPPSRRSRAMAIFSLGSNFGLMVGFILSGYVAVTYGWRYAFLVAGIPGLILAAVTFFTVKEPRRGMSDLSKRVSTATSPTLGASVRFVLGQRSLVLNSLGVGQILFAASALVTWFPSYMERSFSMDVATSGIILGLVLGISGMLGTYFIGGKLADLLSQRDVRWGSWLVGIVSLLTAPFYLLFSLAPDVNWAVASWVVVGSMGLYFQGPIFSLAQSVTPPPMRSKASALMLLFMQLTGVAMGSLMIGILSDYLEPAYGQESLRHAFLLLPVHVVAGALCCFTASRYLKNDLARAEAF